MSRSSDSTTDKEMSIYSFMRSLVVEELTDNIDALTVTSKSLEGRLAIDFSIEKMRPLFEDERKREWSFRGAIGYSRGSLRYAAQRSPVDNSVLWCILMITGEHSSEALRHLYGYDGIKYTRVDVNVDVKLQKPVRLLAKMIYDLGRISRTKRLIQSSSGDTVYVGSRESDIYVRVYDKSEEYEEELGTVWRFEVECKGEYSPRVVEELANDTDIQDIVFGVCQNVGIPTPKGGTVPRIRKKSLTLSSNEMSVNWLYRQVRPTVEHLKSVGMLEQVKMALGLNEI